MLFTLHYQKIVISIKSDFFFYIFIQLWLYCLVSCSVFHLGCFHGFTALQVYLRYSRCCSVSGGVNIWGERSSHTWHRYCGPLEKPFGGSHRHVDSHVNTQTHAWGEDTLAWAESHRHTWKKTKYVVSVQKNVCLCALFRRLTHQWPSSEANSLSN